MTPEERQAADELTALTEELGLYDDPPAWDEAAGEFRAREL